MDDFTAHPDDSTLYDLVEGLLDPAREAEVASHLESCPSCARFAEAGLAGSNAIDDAPEKMPHESAERMLLALDTAWQERRAEVTAARSRDVAPAAADEQPVPAAPVATDDTLVLTPIAGDVAASLPGAEASPRRARRFPRMRARTLVPVLALLVLAGLAGTSWFAGEQRTPTAVQQGDSESATSISTPAAGASSAPVEPEVATSDGTTSTDSGVQGATGTGTNTGIDPEDRRTVTEDAASASGDDLTDAETDEAEAYQDPTTSDAEATDADADINPGAEAEADDSICIATFDETRLVLPEGRIPQRIVRGPLGLYVVCG